MKRATLLLFVCFLAGSGLCAQELIDRIINPGEVEKIERVLSSDDMQGRATFTPGIEKAADFIEAQFKTAGLRPLGHSHRYRQPFTMIQAKPTIVSASLDSVDLPAASVVVISSVPQMTIDETSGYEKATIRAGANIFTELQRYARAKKNWLVLVDTGFAKGFRQLGRLVRQHFKSDFSVVFLLTTLDPVHYRVRMAQELTESNLANVVGVLPGRSKKEEFVIFSAHYDHLGIGKPDSRGDSIYNGANDDASGSTAVIMLARYFARMHNNERTLIFATFTAEEIGEYGSQYFSQQFEPDSVTAMFNIEMIGTESKWGTNSAFITGYERTDMGKILEKNLEGSQFAFHPDPYPEQQLFYRSDNASLARQGVPAHTISTSKMDSEKYYHTLGDEIGTLDMNNMARIIHAIALSSRSIVAGTDAPSRVDASQLR
jgi:Zn-dependent M28 family amino/carboxypeptidase